MFLVSRMANYNLLGLFGNQVSKSECFADFTFHFKDDLRRCVLPLLVKTNIINVNHTFITRLELLKMYSPPPWAGFVVIPKSIVNGKEYPLMHEIHTILLVWMACVPIIHIITMNQ